MSCKLNNMNIFVNLHRNVKFTFNFQKSSFNKMLKINFLKYPLLFILLVLPLAHMGSSPSGEIPQAVIDALKTGNSVVLSRYFHTSIELAIPGKEDIYSNKQAELIVKDFFSKHVPSGFVILHKGGKDDSQYAIGNLSTSNGRYRVTLLIKMREGKPYIHQLRFEEANAD